MRQLRRCVALTLLAIGGLFTPALAHDLTGPADWPPAWTLDPWIVAPLVASVGLFGLGWARLYGRSGYGRPMLRRRAVLFLAGWSTLAVALVSPLHQAGERSFTAHMLEHELLMLAAAPMLVAAEPLAIMLWAFPVAGRRGIGTVARTGLVAGVWRTLTQPVTATLVQAAALWLWHMPSLFDRALASNGWHVAQHLSFLVSALLFWSAMLHPRGGLDARNGARMVAALCLFATSVVSGALGAVMAVSDSPWYAGYAAMGMAPFGLTPSQDQQMAGLLMWIPGGLVHAGAALALVGAILKPGIAAHGTSDAR